jgi:amino acid transporter
MKATLKRASLFASAVSIIAMVNVSTALAQFAGPSPEIGTPGGADESQLREIIINIIKAVLNFLALLAVIVIVIAGIRLIVSQGEEEPKEKAKKTILYALIGLIIVLFSRVIVGMVTEYLSDEVR